ncbi:peroxisomal membrane protein PEX13 [Diorhabda carinulata]|uniref:peroxisomal membrane protein PEX13 n=1 Tax=Diorhabda sublineata TaxID=1163346 RepID=UPI0024E15EFA|nr:peroxisomal membrane protein PEX13 [Diorhabda sublineata]XP_057657036.1 peroxisomal membrane protein PEX13 [Diorhabda carinulata]
MSASKPFEDNNLQNSSQYIRNSINLPVVSTSRSAPLLPPRPSHSLPGNTAYNSFNSCLPYSNPYSSYSSYNNSYLPYRNSPYGSYGSYGSYDSYNSLSGGYPINALNDHERRFIQYAEESSRNTFASVESIVRAFNSLAMMLDNTFFAMTSSFRAVLSVAENFGRLRTMFGNIWYSVNIFRFFNWLYRKFLIMLGFKKANSNVSMAWSQAKNGAAIGGGLPGGAGSSWPTIAFLGVLVSAPYIISKFLPKYEDKGDPTNWKHPGVRAKAIFDFIGTAPNELTIQTNDLVLLAPTYIQEEMNLKNSGWAFAVCKGKSGVVPLNYLVISKSRPILQTNKTAEPPVPKVFPKTHQKRVSFGENQIYENVDLDDYMIKNDSETKQPSQEIKLEDTKKEENEKT